MVKSNITSKFREQKSSCLKKIRIAIISKARQKYNDACHWVIVYRSAPHSANSNSAKLAIVRLMNYTNSAIQKLAVVRFLTKIVDPNNGKPSSTVTLDLQNIYRCSKDFLTVKEKNTKQSTLVNFFAKK